MSGSTISTTVTTTVALGSPTYPSPLTVTSIGILTNSGAIKGGYGSFSCRAGILPLAARRFHTIRGVRHV